MKKFLVGLIALVIMPLALAGKPPVFTKSGSAIRGYDPVAYFTLGEPTKGSDQFSTSWNGATFKFSSADHLALF
ncbi:MAG: YHS domain protein, partial [Gammaproteobacteria bacterium]|nr:YHS domain protein [Gammaproteobacteria bacterium]